MKAINLLILLPALWLTACSGTSLPGQDSPSGNPSADPSRREVRMELPGELELPGVGTRAPLALEEEMSIAAMDVYCFGSDTDNGSFTFCEKFSYRQNNSTVAGAVPMTIVRSGNRITAVLSPEKGQFVKLYCVVNQPRLLRADGSEATFTCDVSTEDDLTACTTDLSVLLHDTLVPPLPMAGALADVLDLTDRKATSVCVVNMSLKRLVARFDILNYSTGTHFRLDSIGMGNGRAGTTLYPAEPAGNRITYCSRKFSGTDEGMTSGAFYAYPSLEADQGYLILKGRIGDTAEPVTYRVDFRQYNPTGAGGFINIKANHRYLLQIASDEGVHFRIKDWEDVNLDDYYPDNAIRSIVFRDTTGLNTYTPETHTVEMGWGEECENEYYLDCFSGKGTTAVVNFNGNSPWFTLTQHTDSVKDTYTINYIEGKVPPAVGATIVIRNKEGVDSLVYVKPYIGAPLGDLTYGIHNKSSYYDDNTSEVVAYTLNRSRFTITVPSRDGSRVLRSSLPYEMTSNKSESQYGEVQTIYTFTFPETNTTAGFDIIEFANRRDGSKKAKMKMRVEDIPCYYWNGTDSIPAHYLGGMWWTPVSLGPTNWAGFACPSGWARPTYYTYAALLRSENFRDWSPQGYYWTTTQGSLPSHARYMAYIYASSIGLPEGSGQYGNINSKYSYRCVRSR